MPVNPDNKNSISLNKYIADTGYCSRRKADLFIKDGVVTINGTIAQGGNRVEEGDVVLINGNSLQPKESLVYLIVNKPVGITCTGDKKDPDNIIKFLNYPKRIFYVGRLDKMSEGVLFMTNDGDIVNKILRAGNNHEKEYLVTVNRPITQQFIKKMSRGVPILDTVTKKCFVKQEGKFVFRIILTQGLNRQIRRMCEYLDYNVRKLVRVRVMHMELGRLRSGQWREFTSEELKELKNRIQDSNPEAAKYL